MSTYILIGIAAVIITWFIIIYNQLVKLLERAKEAWADIDVQLKRRYDLIPNLVNTVKGYATHEKEAFESVTRARSAAMGAGTVAEHAKAENALTGTLKSLFAISEAYPELKANENFLGLARELADTENKIQAARRFYNTNVRDLNISIKSFPSNVVAKSISFANLEFFDLDEKSPEREVVNVSL